MPDKLADVRPYAIKAANREPVVRKTDTPPDMADKVNLLLTVIHISVTAGVTTRILSFR